MTTFGDRLHKRPSSRSRRRSARAKIRLSWVTSKIVQPCFFAKLCIRPTTSRPDFLSKAAVGSSARRIFRYVTKARAIAVNSRRRSCFNCNSPNWVRSRQVLIKRSIMAIPSGAIFAPGWVEILRICPARGDRYFLSVVL